MVCITLLGNAYAKSVTFTRYYDPNAAYGVSYSSNISSGSVYAMYTNASTGQVLNDDTMTSAIASSSADTHHEDYNNVGSVFRRMKLELIDEDTNARLPIYLQMSASRQCGDCWGYGTTYANNTNGWNATPNSPKFLLAPTEITGIEKFAGSYSGSFHFSTHKTIDGSHIDTLSLNFDFTVPLEYSFTVASSDLQLKPTNPSKPLTEPYAAKTYIQHTSNAPIAIDYEVTLQCPNVDEQNNNCQLEERISQTRWTYHVFVNNEELAVSNTPVTLKAIPNQFNIPLQITTDNAPHAGEYHGQFTLTFNAVWQ